MTEHRDPDELPDERLEQVFEWAGDDLADALAGALLVEDAEAANVTLHRDNGADTVLVVLRLRTRTKEDVKGEVTLALTQLQADTIAAAFIRLKTLGSPTSRRN